MGAIKRCAVAVAALLCCITLSACSAGADGTFENVQQSVEAELDSIYVAINDEYMELGLEDNAAAQQLVSMLASGDITYTASDYGGFEKVGSLGFSLPSSDSYITAQAGDVMLYNGSQLVIFYGSNGWQYTRIGRISGTAEQIASFVRAGHGSVTVRLTLGAD